MSTPPRIRRHGDRLLIDTTAGELTIVPSSPNRAAARWWRLLDGTGRPVSPWLATPRIAAAWAVSTASGPDGL